MKKKLVALLLSALMLLSCLPASLAEGAVSENLEPVTLEYWIMGPGKQKDSDRVWEKFNEMLQEYLPNTTVNFTIVPDSEYYDRWSRAMAAGEQIDLAWIGWFHNIPSEASMGSIQPMDDLLDKYGQDVKAFYGDDILNMHRVYDGRLYAIPVWQGLVGGRYAMRFPKELADLAGENWVDEFQQVMYDNCKTMDVDAKAKVYDKLEEYFKACKDAGRIGMGYNMQQGLYSYYDKQGSVLVGPYAYVERGDDTFTVKPLLTSDVVKLNCEYMADWYQKGYIRPDIASVENIEADFRRDGLNGYITNGSDGLIDIAKHATAESGFDVVAAYTNPDAEFSLGFSTATCIPYTSKNPERAVMLMNLLVSDAGRDLYRLLVYGFEGEHWNYTEAGDGTIETTGGLGQSTGDWNYGLWKWTFGTCTNALYTTTDIVGEYEDKKELEKNAYVNPLISFSFDADAVETEEANIRAIETEYLGLNKPAMLFRGYLGAEWEQGWNELQQKLELADYDAYIAEVQRQVTEYVEANGVKW